MSRQARASIRTLSAAWCLILAAPAGAQLDPLLPLRATTPNVVIALDLSSRMLRDPAGRYHDPRVYTRLDEPFEASLGVTPLTRAYRRRFVDMQWLPVGADVKAAAAAVEIVGDAEASFASFDASTRLGRVALALQSVVERNLRSVRFGLLTTRQASPRLDLGGPASVAVRHPPPDQPTDTAIAGQWRAGIPSVVGPGALAPMAQAVVPADAAAANSTLLQLLAKAPASAGALLPAGFDAPDVLDAPVAALLDDARAEAERLIARDGTCCNTIVVVLTGGGDPSVGVSGLNERAVRFLSVGGRRVPLYIVALAPTPAETGQLRAAAAAGGGRYVEVPAETIERVSPRDAVPEIASALCFAVQHAFVPFATFNTPPAPPQLAGPSAFFPGGGVVVGTVDLGNAVDAGGRLLPGTRVTSPQGVVLPQPSNVMFTPGFELPGFLGRLSAFRVYRPVPDDRRTPGYRFSADGTRLWTARTPPPEQRNIFTVLPGEGLVPFRAAAAGVLAPFLRTSDPAAVIEAVRAAPLGAIVSSTPALLEPPAMPLVDASYVEFAERHARRRGLVFVGANDGMLHAIDARTGVEVWAVVPFNLLPKLHSQALGAGLDDFPYFVDGSPRLADVHVLGAWRSVLLVGEGRGGTFYQAFDVTLDDIANRVPPDADDLPSLLAWFSDPTRIRFLWSFPRYEAFDAALGRFGDLRASATPLEKSVGETWSTPVIGRAGDASGPFVAVLGSGALSRSRELEDQRGGVRAGTRIYLVDAATGTVTDSRDVGTDGIGEARDACADAACVGLKNALQADPLAAGDGAAAVARVYQGDLDGRLWRFDLAAPGPGPPAFAGAPRLLLEAGSDQPIVGSVAILSGTAGRTYLFVGAGSDLLPRFGGASAYHLFGLAESAAGTTRQFDRLLRSEGADGLDEAISGAPAVGGAAVFFATTARPRGGCEAVEASLYAMTVSGGAAYDTNADARRDPTEPPVVARVRAGRATAPVVADRHVFLATGDRLQVLGDPDGFAAGPGFGGIRVVSWRVVR